MTCRRFGVVIGAGVVSPPSSCFCAAESFLSGSFLLRLLENRAAWGGIGFELKAFGCGARKLRRVAAVHMWSATTGRRFGVVVGAGVVSPPSSCFCVAESFLPSSFWLRLTENRAARGVTLSGLKAFGCGARKLRRVAAVHMWSAMTCRRFGLVIGAGVVSPPSSCFCAAESFLPSSFWLRFTENQVARGVTLSGQKAFGCGARKLRQVAAVHMWSAMTCRRFGLVIGADGGSPPSSCFCAAESFLPSSFWLRFTENRAAWGGIGFELKAFGCRARKLRRVAAVHMWSATTCRRFGVVVGAGVVSPPSSCFCAAESFLPCSF
ncbi:hypothetical protein Q31a_51630 [Aureliella helgolandensis]|uniref:Uncharacterized protein n=1 Tax=Aureliella helgolandensis TaxID=2527968 RepID=A0A518GDV9_9BACT|nr:hypothetical protein Q31a_51630 [Aureliella helgolandensis]